MQNLNLVSFSVKGTKFSYNIDLLLIIDCKISLPFN